MHCPSGNGSDYLICSFNSLLMVILITLLQKEATILFSGIHKELELYLYTRTKNHFNKMKKEVGLLLQKRADTSAVGIYKLYEENTH